jgi:hypothetical protein
MVRLLLLGMILSFSVKAHGQNDEIPDPLTWWNQLPDAAWQDQPTVIRHLTVRSNHAARTKRWEKAMQDFSALGFFQYVPLDAVDFIQRLNPQENLNELPKELLLDPGLLQLVLLDRGTKISVLGNSQRSYKTIATWPVTNNDRRNAASVLSWLSKNLGYDAVVLDARGGLILAGLLKNTSELGQGLLVKQSSKRWVIKESSTRGEALLQMLKSSGSLAVFEVLLAKGETLDVEKGSKILLGQNHNWMKLLQAEPAKARSKAQPQALPPIPPAGSAQAPKRP